MGLTSPSPSHFTPPRGLEGARQAPGREWTIESVPSCPQFLGSPSSLHSLVHPAGSSQLGGPRTCSPATSGCPPCQGARGGPVLPSSARSAWPGNSSAFLQKMPRGPLEPDLVHSGPQDSVRTPFSPGTVWSELHFLHSSASALPGPPCLALQPQIRTTSTGLPLCPPGAAVLLGGAEKQVPGSCSEEPRLGRSSVRKAVSSSGLSLLLGQAAMSVGHWTRPSVQPPLCKAVCRMKEEDCCQHFHFLQFDRQVFTFTASCLGALASGTKATGPSR